ncbi:anti sigma factor C-terminal domain-containing protein [Bacillus sp. B15-48]|uniref:anti sigma factor C-terminal domain-containing protein n=1 Tax=Bacillus sp. B15-48 TaxID=1548601 RepID=UPI00193FB056|nr:anti sigma factor C-terminal domain-containing protein [Bacillus sp. B15-48]MBM4763485.1 alkaline phosphatase [Bacillus sp. B15-48]
MKEDKIPMLGDEQVNKMLKKAKRKSVIKQIIISAIVTLVLVPTMFLGINHLSNRSYINMSFEIDDINKITRPNTQLVETMIRYGLFGGEAEYTAYKVIEGIPVPLGKENYEYNFLNNFSRKDKFNVIKVPEGESGISYHINSMQRDMQFYHPMKRYSAYQNDAKIMGRYPGKVAEMAISFDKPYSIDEIQKMLPNGVNPAWYWVDTYENPEKLDSPDSSLEVYGIAHNSNNVDPKNDFLVSIEKGYKEEGRYKREYKRVYDVLRGGNEKPTEDDVHIIGVVVTGKTEDLTKLNGQAFARAVVLGAMAEDLH